MFDDDTNTTHASRLKSTPGQVLGLDGAPQAGEKSHWWRAIAEAREQTNSASYCVNKQYSRKNILRWMKSADVSPSETSKQLNIIIKGDVDGSVLKRWRILCWNSTNEVQVNIDGTNGGSDF